MYNTTTKYKVIVVGSLLLCKIQLVPLVHVPSFLKIDTNQTVSMITDLYTCLVRKNVITCLKRFFHFSMMC
jgi:hypothetical protein